MWCIGSPVSSSHSSENGGAKTTRGQPQRILVCSLTLQFPGLLLITSILVALLIQGLV